MLTAVHILLAEDSSSDAELLQETLRRAGAGRFEVTWVDSLADGLARLGRQSFDVLLLDLNLPDSFGPDTFRRARNAAPGLPIVVLTGSHDESVGLAAVHEGIQDYLVKGESDGRQIAHAVRYAMERKRAEEAIRQASDQRLLALEAAGMGAWDYHIDADEISLDECCRNMYGLPAGDRMGLQAVLRCVHEDDRAAVEEAGQRAMAGVGGGVYHGEFRVVWPDGSVHWVDSRGRVYFQGDGEQRRAVRFAGVNLDITERKQSEKRFRQAQKLESIGLLAGGIAHDFNNLLTGIMGTTSLVMDDVAPEIAEQLQNVISGARRAAHLTQQLLAYAGKGQFVVKDVCLTQFVRGMTDLLRLSVPKNVELRLDLQDGLPVVTMDPGQLQQVLMNLVINAGEAIGDGRQGKITLMTGLRDVSLPFVDALGGEVAAGRYVYLEVADTGPGMDEATKAKIFDPFFTTKFTGRGLGLAAVSGIVRAQGAALSVESHLGQGSTFRVLFPAVGTGRPEAPPQPGERARATILVVDDEAPVRAFMADALRKRGYRIVEACDGREALALLEREQERLDAIVLDVVMPLMGGHELLPEALRRRPGVKVILTSGYGESEVRRVCGSHSGVSFLQKPFTAGALGDTLERLLQARGVKATAGK